MPVPPVQSRYLFRKKTGWIDDITLIHRFGNDFTLLHTVGNAKHACPELLMFIPPHKEQMFSYALQEISRFMRQTGAMPEPGRPMTVHNWKFCPVLMDHIFIALYAPLALHSTHQSEDVKMFQLHIPDLEGLYPHEPGYDINFLYQPVLKCH